MAGPRSDREHVSGIVMQPGHRAEQLPAHAVRRAVKHGADPRPLISDEPLPSNMTVFGIADDGAAFSLRGTSPEVPPEVSPVLTRHLGADMAVIFPTVARVIPPVHRSLS